MKSIVFIVILLTTTAGYTCNQKMYDQIYKAIIVDTLKKDANLHRTFIERNRAITTLRSLCNGQKSSWEKDTPEVK